VGRHLIVRVDSGEMLGCSWTVLFMVVMDPHFYTSTSVTKKYTEQTLVILKYHPSIE
jgi:hypothetical protein